ncbi:MAG TPA: PrsW family glutamic-type intramembrane protease [bacterium]|nr:PrsW family glutamic-type intramembrane protease [bacterium]
MGIVLVILIVLAVALRNAMQRHRGPGGGGPRDGGAGLKRAGLIAGYVLLLLGLAAGLAILSTVPYFAPVWFLRLSGLVVATAGLGGGAALVYHLRRSLRGLPSAGLALPSPWWFVAAIPVVIAAGEYEIFVLMSGTSDLTALIRFLLLIIAGAALGPAAVLAYLAGTTGPETTWRRATLCAAAGGTLSVLAVLTVGTVVPLTAAGLAVALRNLGAGLIRDLTFSKSTQDVARIFFSDRGVYAIATVAVAAPIAEEFLKPLGVIILGRRVRSPGEAFLLGASCGAGFAILENILYESAPPVFWGGIVFIRSIGAALHPMGAGLMALGWYGVFHGHPDAWRRLGVFYLIAITQHWLWNMATVATVLLVEPMASGAFTVSILGVAVWTVLLLYFLGQGAAMFAAVRYVGRLVARVPAGQPVPPLAPVRLASPRGIAIAATASLVAMMPLGAAGIQAFLMSLGRR